MDEESKSELGKLLIAITEGDSTAIVKLYGQCARVMYMVAAIYLKEKSDIMDAIHDSLMKIVRKAKYYRQGTNAYAWINKIVENTARDLARTNRRRQYVPLDDAQLQIEFDEDSIIADEALGVLSEEERRIVGDYYWRRMTFEEIAKDVGKGKTTVHHIFHSAINKLQTFFSE